MSPLATVALRFDRVELRVPQGLETKAVSDLAVDAEGSIHVLTRGPGMVIVHSPDGRYLRHYGEFVHAHGITIDHENRTHVVDEGAHRVLTFADDGTLVRSLGTGVPSDSGCDWSRPTYKEKYLSVVRGAGPFNRPTAVAVAPDGSCFVTDGYGNARVHGFDACGVLRRSWGEPGSGTGQFRLPHGVCLLPGGDVLVADRENDRLQRFAPDGTHVATWDGFQRPSKPIVTADGRIVVGELGRPVGDYSFACGDITEELPPQIVVLDAGGTVLGRSVIPRRPSGEPSSPHGLAEGPDGTIWVGELAAASGASVASLVTVRIDGPT